MSALSSRKIRRNSDLAVNILYGSNNSLFIKSSIIVPIYELSLSKINGSSPFILRAALIPAIIPCAAASS